MAPPTDAIVAGSKAFALALFAPVTERVGSRPRIAADPAQVLALAPASGGVLLVEYEERWLAAIQQLRQQAPALSIVAALPAGQESAVLTLDPLGVEAVPWDGRPVTVVDALARVLERGAPRPAATPPPAAAPRPTPPAAAPRPPPATAAPRPAAPAARPAPAMTPAPGAVAAAPPRPTPAPAPPRAPVAPRPPAAAVAAPAAPVAVAPPAAPVLSAAPVAVAVAASPLAAPAEPADDFFADLASAGPDEADEASSVQPLSAPLPPQRTEAGPWPGALPAQEEAERMVVAALAQELKPTVPHRAAVDQVVASFSDAERGALTGAPVALDAALVRQAAGIRVRVAAALVAPPAEGAPVDMAAVGALLADIDALLARVNEALGAAGDEVKPALEALRNTLVKEAVDFSEASHASGPLEPAAEPSAPRKVTGNGVRVLSVETEAEAEPRRYGVWVALALAVAVAAAFHGYGYWRRSQAAQRLAAPSAGAPSGMTAIQATPRGPTLVEPAGSSVPNPVAVEQFKEQQSLQGKQVVEGGGGVIVVLPEKAPAAAPKP